MVTHTTCPIRLWLGMEQVLLLFLLISFDGLDLHLSPCLCFLLISFHELDLHIYPCPCFLLNSVLDLHLSPWLCLLISFHNLDLHFYPCLCFLHGIWERRGHNNCVQISIIFFSHVYILITPKILSPWWTQPLFGATEPGIAPDWGANHTASTSVICYLF